VCGVWLAVAYGNTADADGAEPASARRTVAIKGATVLTMARKTIEDGTIVIQDGKIATVGKELPIAATVDVIDARGRYVTPGLVDPHSHLGLYLLPSLEASSDGNEMTGPIQSQVRSEDAINTDDPEIPRAVSGGVTTIQIVPGSGNNIGGWNTIIKLKGEQSLERLKISDAPPSMKWAWGENQKRAYGSRGELPSTLMGEAALVRQKLYEAQNYLAKWKTWEEGGKKGAPPERNLQLEALAQVLEGKVRVNVHAYQVNHFEAVLRIADEFKFPIASFHHALCAYMIAPEIARRKIGIITFASNWGYKVEAWDAIPQNAYLLWKQGVTVSFHTDNPVLEERHYIGEAVIATHYGMPDEAALEAITINPARILGIDQRLGSIEVGKDADLVIWDGYPLDLRSKVEMVFIDGELVYTQKEGFIPWKARSAGLLLQP